MGKKQPAQPLTNNEVRAIMLRYFYDRNQNATSVQGKKGAAATISIIRAELKASSGLTAQQVVSNLTYLESQEWVEAYSVEKSIPTRTGTIVPSVKEFYRITAAGIDKIEGPGEFTRDPFHGIRIDATGQNIITVGDGNQVNAVYKDVGEALSSLADAVRSCTEIGEREKLGYVADIESLQMQLAKPEPNRPVLRALWAGLQGLATIEGVSALAVRAHQLLGPLLGGGS